MSDNVEVTEPTNMVEETVSDVPSQESNELVIDAKSAPEVSDNESDNLYRDAEEKKENEVEDNKNVETNDNLSSDKEEGDSDNEENEDEDEDDDDEEESSSESADDNDEIRKEQEEKNDSSESNDSDDIKQPSTGISSKDENVDSSLLQKQMEYIKEGKLLENDEFKDLPEQEKAAAILKFLNSNPTTAIPNSENIMESSNKKPETIINRTNVPASISENVTASRVDLNAPMTAKERELYSVYLRGENKITEMHNIPPKSRLFIGNLPLKNVSKEDLFRIFSPYGHILQINIKNAFGFIQYNNPGSVLDAIKYEIDQMNFGKKLILEVSSSNARPQFDHGDHGTNNSSTFISTVKRPFETEGYDNAAQVHNDNGSNYKRAKRRTPECLIFVKRTADRAYATEIFNSIKNGTGLETDMMFLKPRMELWKLVNDAAFDGTWGVILVNKTHNVDIQTFYKGPQGETKFDEYVSVSAQDAVGVFNNLKASRRSDTNMQRPSNSGSFGYSQPSMSAPPVPQQPPQQGYYGNYSMPPPQQSYNIPPPQQGYNMPPPQQGYNMPPAQMDQNYGRYQGGSPADQGYSRYQGMPPQQQVPPQPSQNAQLSALLGGNTGQMDQQQLLTALQSLPPNTISNLLSAAQQQQQQQQPIQQQQLLGLLQSAQQQQQQPTNYPLGNPTNPQMSNSYNREQTSVNRSRLEQPPVEQNNAGNNVQSLLDSLAKLQK